MILAVCTVVAVGVRYPSILMIAAFVMTPFQTALFGEGAEVRMGVVDLLALAMCLPLAMRVITGHLPYMGRAGAMILLFLIEVTLSSALAGFTSEAGVSLVRMLTNTLLPVLLYANLDRRLLTYHRCYRGYLVAVNLLSICVMFAFARGGFQASMYTLGMSKNFLGPVIGCGIGIATVYVVTDGLGGKRGAWLLFTLATASVAMVLTLSRGAWIATAAGLMVAVCTTRNVRLVATGAFVGIVACMLSWKLLPDTATRYASDMSSGASTIRLRLEYIDYVMDKFRANPVLGVGVGLRKVMEPHNVLVLTAGESGVVGIILFVGMFIAGFATTIGAWRKSRESMPARQIAALATVVLCVTLADGMMDVYWRRGIGFMGWSGVGMSVMIGLFIPRSRQIRPSVGLALSPGLA